MRRSRSSFGGRLRHALRGVTAVVTIAQLLVVVGAPLADRADSSVAAVHMEQAGTSRHHAHGDFCAICAASHFTALPPRAAAVFDNSLVVSRPPVTDAAPPARSHVRYAFARAPPV